MSLNQGTEYYAGHQDRQSDGDGEKPVPVNNDRSNRHEDDLFHLQQELLRQELPQQQWREIREQQSQQLERSPRQEELMWQRRHRAGQTDTSRESMTSEHSKRGTEKSGCRGGKTTGASFNLDSDYLSDGPLCTPFLRSEKSWRLPPIRTSRNERDTNLSRSLGGQPHYASDGNQGQLPIQHCRSTGSIRPSPRPFDDGTVNDCGNSNFFARRSYHDERSIQNHPRQYFHAPSYSTNRSSNKVPFQPYRRGGGETAHAATSLPAVTNTSFAPKRRRLNFHDGDSTSNEKLMLEMLTDTVVSPKRTKEHVRTSSTDPNDGTSDKDVLIDGGLLSPFSNYINPMCHENVSPIPLTQTKGAGIVGNIPTMFADIFLGEPTGNSGGRFDMSAMPPPPLVQNGKLNRKNSSGQSNVLSTKNASLKRGDADLISQAYDSLDQMPLPRNKSRQRNSQYGKKKSSRAKGKKKTKDGTSSGSVRTSNHIITPSSATISALSAEIRSKMQSPSSQDRDVANDARSFGNDPDNTFSMPNFASAMEASQASQQAIHDWDRKFGLRRAHSKTMRESCRSRKKVLDFLKGEGANLLLQKSSSSRESGLKASISNTAMSMPCCQKDEERRDVVKDIGNLKNAALKPTHNEELDGIALQVQQKPFRQEEKQDSHGITGSVSSVNDQRNQSKSGNDSDSEVEVQLEHMFRRASLDCSKSFMHEETITAMPSPPQEGDRKQFHARSA